MFVIQSTISLRTVETALLSIRSQGSLHRAKKISEKSLAMRLGTTAEQASFQSPSAVSQVCHRLSGRSRSVLGRTYNSKPLPFSDIGATSTGETGHLRSHPLGLNTHQQAMVVPHTQGPVKHRQQLFCLSGSLSNVRAPNFAPPWLASYAEQRCGQRERNVELASASFRLRWTCF